MSARASIILCLFVFILHSSVAAQPKKFHFTEQKMGSPFNLVFLEQDSLKAATLAKECFSLVDSLASIFSDYDSTSELSGLNQRSGTGPVHVSPALMEILMDSKYAYEKSNHSFDISIGPLSVLWRKARKTKVFPTEKEVLEAKQLVNFKQVKIDEPAQTVSLGIKGMRLDLGGIAKGYIADQVIQLLSRKGVMSALADAGGDISISRAPSGSKGWLVGINVPDQTEEVMPDKLILENVSVATSGDVYQYLLHNGKKYAHITNPETGYGVTFQRNVTIISKNGATADWLATACSILPIAEALALVEKEQSFALITLIEKNQVKSFSSKGFEHFYKKD